MQAWTASPYDGVGVYIGGVNRSCSQPNLTVLGDGGIAAGLADHSDLRGPPGAVQQPTELGRVHDHHGSVVGHRRRGGCCRPRRWACCRAAQSTATWSTTRRGRGMPYGGLELCLGLDQGTASARLLPVRDVCQPDLRGQTPLGGLHLTRLCTPGRNMDRALGRQLDAHRVGRHPQRVLAQSSAREAVSGRP